MCPCPLMDLCPCSTVQCLVTLYIICALQCTALQVDSKHHSLTVKYQQKQCLLSDKSNIFWVLNIAFRTKTWIENPQHTVHSASNLFDKQQTNKQQLKTTDCSKTQNLGDFAVSLARMFNEKLWSLCIVTQVRKPMRHIRTCNEQKMVTFNYCSHRSQTFSFNSSLLPATTSMKNHYQQI